MNAKLKKNRSPILSWSPEKTHNINRDGDLLIKIHNKILHRYQDRTRELARAEKEFIELPRSADLAEKGLAQRKIATLNGKVIELKEIMRMLNEYEQLVLCATKQNHL